ncbi:MULTISPECIES: alpha/beta fold hydrolase [unclassified Rhodococcus (in: high G+C Gram-positive bacteria)]|uniref:alpha/beta fold hydrolase n=1 Tax=unclassified Rhodococcus (in: high G+C Gram-positive bacteria) TaxID=192944 RepID=UPI0015826619|nr:alpha/beta fold hydrolase [Rhodococcus sp. W8901]QKT13108.1 alpha/beta fold hydrolase [Rhodococcus sp. W8901]
MREITLDLDAVRLQALTWGPETGRLAVLLHGFPDTAHTWRHLGPALADEGWRVVAPFTRGYAPSAVPEDHSGHVAALMDDAVAIHARLGGGSDAVLVGHDWGATTANALAAHAENPFVAVASLSVPPFAALRTPAAVRVLPRQLCNSWYVLFNQLPLLPERHAERLVRRLWADWSPGYDAGEDLPAVLEAIADSAHRRAVFGYYRNMLRPFPRPPARYRRWAGAEMRLPAVPTLYLHGGGDGCLDPRLAVLVGPGLPPGSETHVIEGAGHFLQLEQPAAVNARIVEFLAGH